MKEAEDKQPPIFSTMTPLLKQVLSSIETKMLKQNTLSGISTGYAPLDRVLGGMRAGDGYYLLASPPSAGKTALALNIALHVACEASAQQPPRRVLYVTADLKAESLVERLIMIVSNENWYEYPDMYMSTETMRSLCTAVKKLRDLALDFLDASAMSAEQTAATIQKLCSEQEYSLVVVDYIQLFSMENRPASYSRADELEHVSGIFRSLGKALPAPLLILAQLSYPANKGHTPDMTDVKGSGAFAEHASAVMILYRETRLLREGESLFSIPVNLILDKNAHGSAAAIPLRWKCNTFSFSDAPDEESSEESS